MIEVINYHHKTFEKQFEPFIAKSYDEVRALLPALPEKMQIYFAWPDFIIPEIGSGGYAYSPGIITLSLDPSFKDRKSQLHDLRATIFHESFHEIQNYTGHDEDDNERHFSALEEALYEGMATVFERDYAEIKPQWGDYSQISTSQLKAWVEVIRHMGNDTYYYGETWRKWKLYDPETKTRWIIYRVGAYMTDQVLKANKLDIIELAPKTAAEVLAMYDALS